ncbi:hypothetical protein HPB47_022162 [Ixodes persulcatus]|uniref:Uncharacterized protein n=1 Tax=Ixodes persulcatus TaxID=34615 RepID=A0AC60QD00_IXOPE|nr:hypothetical protein HPB47_022162 [Ixodes persulcatus]
MLNAKVAVLDGKFNALEARGYSRATRKGDDLWQAAANHDLALVTDPAFLTGIGNSCSWDTTPDLTFFKNVGAVSWHNLNEDLGSDHNILATCISVKCKPLKEFTITDWDQFRKRREERALIQDLSIDLERWVTQLKRDVKSATKTVQTDLEIDRMNSRLAHFLEAKKALLDRWKGQRLNRRLRKKIAEFNRTTEDHCRSLTR